MATRKLLDSLDAQPHYRLMTAEQAVKILDRIFAEDSKSALEGASILYKASVEPQRFLLHLGPLCVIVVLLGLVWAEAPVGLSCKEFSYYRMCSLLGVGMGRSGSGPISGSVRLY
eukprot:Tamp_21686.p1 GENE.Tamp_21686~~Tamp_21686.p1  ORF type:complete len:115 (+),score=0.25 Tamp_21686:402-746(+)